MSNIDRITLKKERISLTKGSAKSLKISLNKVAGVEKGSMPAKSDFSPEDSEWANDLASPNLEARNTCITETKANYVDPNEAMELTPKNIALALGVLGCVVALGATFASFGRQTTETPATTITMSASAPSGNNDLVAPNLGDEGLAMNEIPNTGPTTPRTTTTVTSGKQQKYRFWLVEKLGKAYEGERGYCTLEVLCDNYTNIIYYREVSVEHDNHHEIISAPVMQVDPEDGSPLTLRRYYEIYHE